MFSADKPVEMTITRMVRNTCKTKVNRMERMARYRQIMRDPNIDIKIVSSDSLPSWLSLQAQKLVHEHPSALALGALAILSIAIP